MNFSPRSFTAELKDPFVSLQTLSEWTGQSYNTLRNEIKRGKLKAIRMSPRCLRVRMSEAKRYAGLTDEAA